jgi:sulfur relay protein TusB/DsrH
MTTLHTLIKPPSNAPLVEKLLATAQKNDALVLLEDGVYQLESDRFLNNAAHKNLIIRVLESDAYARGINLDKAQGLLIDYSDFVSLCIQHDKVLSWY